MHNMAAARNLNVTLDLWGTTIEPLEASMQILYENHKQVKGNGNIVP
jgi:hypothetical protein